MSVQATAWVLDHSTTRLGARLVLFAIANHADADGRNSWAGVARIAREAGLTERQAQRALATLRDSGEIREVGKAPTRRADRAPKNYELPGFIAWADGVSKMSPRPADGVTSTTERGDISDADGVSKMSPEPSLGSEPSREPSQPWSDAFDEFWEAYPRKVGKRKAREEFGRALTRAPDQRIIRGAIRYRDDPNRVLEFTAHPSTWLHRDGWDDDPLPARGGSVTSIADKLRAEREGTG